MDRLRAGAVSTARSSWAGTGARLNRSWKSTGKNNSARTSSAAWAGLITCCVLPGARFVDGRVGDGVRDQQRRRYWRVSHWVIPAGMSDRCSLKHRSFDRFRHGQGRAGGAGGFRQTVSDLRMPRHGNEISACNRPLRRGIFIFPACPLCQRRSAGASPDSGKRCEY